ncbi:conserved hypothetical protein, partial [Leishmania braziliensis MHOM/BR/75/M2904]
MSKALPPIQDHRPASVEQSHSYSRYSARGSRHEEHQRFYASSARVRSLSPGATADSHLTGLSTLPRLPQVEFSLGPIQERNIPPYNDLEDPHLVPYWARKVMLIQERAAQRRRLRRQQEMEEQRMAAARRRFLHRRHQEREEMASRKGEQTRQREEEERQSTTRGASKNSRHAPTKPSAARRSGATAGGRSRQQAATHRYYEAGSNLHAEEMVERATGGLPADHEYVTSSSSATTIRSASSHSDAASSYSNRHHDEEYYAKEDGAAVPAAPPLTEEEEKTYPDEAGYSTEDMNRDAEPEDAVKEVTSRSSILKSSSSFSSSYSSNRQSSLRDHAAEVAREQAKAEARAEAEAEAGAYVGDGAEDSYADDGFEDNLSQSHHQSSAAAAYLCPQEEDGKAEALLEPEAVYPLETTEEEAHKESYDDDEFEKSFASRDAADDVEGAPAAPLQQQPEYVEEEEAEKPAAADEASDDAKSGSYEEERLDYDELLSPKKASHNTSDADVSLIEKYEEDQAEVSPEDAQCVTATLTATEDVKPSEKDDVEGSAAEVQSQEEYPQTALGQGDGEDEFEDELSTSKSSAAAAYLCPQEEDGKAEALLEPEAVYPLETTEEEAHKESYDDDEFEKSFASRDAADDVEGAPAAPLQQQPEYVEEEEAEKPAAADEASDDAKSGSYEEERLDYDELLSPKKASYNTSDADVSLIEKYEEDQAEVSPEDAQCVTATLTATEDVKPSEKDDVEGSAAEVQSQEEYPQTALGQGDGEDEFEDELSSNKSSATTSVAPSPVAALRKADVPKEEVGEELDRELSPTKAPDAERKREESLMSSSALAPAPPSPSSSNSEVVTAS